MNVARRVMEIPACASKNELAWSCVRIAGFVAGGNTVSDGIEVVAKLYELAARNRVAGSGENASNSSDHMVTIQLKMSRGLSGPKETEQW